MKEESSLLYKKLSKGSLIIIAIFLMLQFILILLQDSHQFLKQRMTKWNAPPSIGKDELFGQERKVKKPNLTLKTIWSSNWQKQFEQWFNTNTVPFRSVLIKLHNQFYYSVLLKSYMNSNGIIVGKKGYLYELADVDKHYNFSQKQYSQEMFNQWADNLQAIANFFHQRGQQFIYIITPSKASYYPEYLPECPQCDLSNVRPHYYGFTKTLKKRGFKFIDASQMTLKAKKDFKDWMFPKGGMHWTLLGSALTTKALIKEISKRYPLPEFQFTYQLNQKPRKIDMDLAGLLNLFIRPRHYLVPKVTVKPLPRKSKEPVKIAIISGSFLADMTNMLSKTHLFDQIDFFFYWKKNHYKNTPHTKSDEGLVLGEVMSLETLEVDARTRRDAVLNAQIVILEENEGNLPAVHSKLFSEEMLMNTVP